MVHGDEHMLIVWNLRLSFSMDVKFSDTCIHPA